MFDLGDPVPLEFEVTGDATVTLAVELPDGTTTNPTVGNPGTGRYTATYVPVQAGLHRVRWTATGALSDAYSDVFNVRPATDLQSVSLADVKAHLNITGGVDDEELRLWIAVATRMVEHYTGEIVSRREFTEQATGPRLRLSRTPLLTVTAPAGATILDAALGDVEVTGSAAVEVVYTAGYRVVPENYLGATAVTAAHLFDTQRFGTLGQQVNVAGDEGQTPFGLAFALPRRAQQMLGSQPPVVA